MIKGKRVYLDDIVEHYEIYDVSARHPGGKWYAVYHGNDYLLDGPFRVLAAGKYKIYWEDKNGKESYSFNSDAGLIPYSENNWNKTNATYEMLDEPVWQDDWF